MTAPSTRNVPAVRPKKACREKRPAGIAPLANGPCPRAVAQTAIADTTKVALAAPRSSKRIDAQTSRGNSSEGMPWLVWSKMKRLAATSRTPSTARSPMRPRGTWASSASFQVRIRGATTRSPMTSPSHQARHVAPMWPGVMTPPSRRLATPIEALAAVLMTPARKIRPSTSWRRSRERRKPGIRESAYAPRSASRVFPAPMPSATRRGAPVQTLATKAPQAIAGQKRFPRIRSAASAIPVGGQTSVAKALTG